MQSAALAGEKVLLTHSGDGLGFVIAIAFAQVGAEVIIHDRSAAVVAAAVEHFSLAVPGSRVRGAHADLSTAAGVREILAFAGSIDILVIDAVGAGVVTFSGNDDQDVAHDRQMLQVRAGGLLNDFLASLKGKEPTSIFLLSLAPEAAAESRTCLMPPSEGPSGHTVYTASLRDLILAPVADLVKSEVLRTNGTVAEVADYLMHDHRPTAIAAGVAAIHALTNEIIQACVDRNIDHEAG